MIPQFVHKIPEKSSSTVQGTSQAMKRRSCALEISPPTPLKFHLYLGPATLSLVKFRTRFRNFTPKFHHPTFGTKTRGPADSPRKNPTKKKTCTDDDNARNIEISWPTPKKHFFFGGDVMGMIKEPPGVFLLFKIINNPGDLLVAFFFLLHFLRLKYQLYEPPNGRKTPTVTRWDRSTCGSTLDQPSYKT